MFKYIPLEEQIAKKQNDIDKVVTAEEKSRADIDYIAMMCDVELDSEEEEGE
jgi:hypothetical protein